MTDEEFAAAWLDPTQRRADITRKLGGLGEHAIMRRVRALGLPPKPQPIIRGATALTDIPARGLMPVPACPDTVADWLYADMQREGMKHAAISERMALLTPIGILAECNVRRRWLGLSPYELVPQRMSA